MLFFVSVIFSQSRDRLIFAITCFRLLWILPVVRIWLNFLTFLSFSSRKLSLWHGKWTGISSIYCIWSIISTIPYCIHAWNLAFFDILSNYSLRFLLFSWWSNDRLFYRNFRAALSHYGSSSLIVNLYLALTGHNIFRRHRIILENFLCVLSFFLSLSLSPNFTPHKFLHLFVFISIFDCSISFHINLICSSNHLLVL